MRRFTLAIGLGTLIFFGAGGVFLIEYWQDQSFANVLRAGWSFPLQLLTGTGAGLLSGGIALYVITRPFFRKERNYYYELISSRLHLSYGVILFISLCAGIGEELFFRAGLQPLLGLWLTSFIFVGLHGYLRVSNWRIAVYGLVMLLIIGGFGYLYRHVGLFAVMIAHSLYDVILFIHMKFTGSKKSVHSGSLEETELDQE